MAGGTPVGGPRFAVGLDVGGTKVLGVLVGPDGTVLHEVLAPTLPGVAGVVERVADAVATLAGRAGVGVGALGGVGIGVPGIVHAADGSVEHAVNLGIDERAPLGRLVAERLGGLVPVRVENDLNVAVVGSAHLRGSGSGDLAFLALGTGLAAGLLLDGRLRRGSRGAAGEIGHLTLVPGGLPCKCGRLGCLEQYASGSALDTAWPSRTGRPAPVEVFEAAAAGDPTAVALRDEFAGAVGAAVRLLVLTCDVQHVVVGGGVSSVGEPLLAAVRQALKAEAQPSSFLRAMGLPERVSLAPVGVPVGAIGAALLGRGDVS